MALRRARRVGVRRVRRVFNRRRYGRRRAAVRSRPFRVRRAFRRRKQISRRVQNDVKFSCKSYEQSVLTWVPPGAHCTNNLCWNQFERPLTAGLFWENNVQFLNNLHEYQWIKFNYIAIKIKELNYYGYTTTNTDSTGKITGVSGITATNFDNMPMYFMWDLEQDMSFTEPKHLKVTAESLSQYQFSKKLYPKNRRGVTFLYRFPIPWRQFFPCYVVRSKSSNQSWTQFMMALSNYSALRCPGRILGAHQNPFFDLIVPSDPAYGVKGRTVIAYNFYLGVTFKGRQLMGTLNQSEPRVFHYVSPQITTSD